MTEAPEAELQASAANLSPVSPSPVHTASPLVVPALQDTVDTIDAMVAAAAATNGDVAAVDLNGAHQVDDAQPPITQDVDIVDGDDDDDDDPYADQDAAEPALPEQSTETQPDAGNDDYAKAFDSPVNSEPETGDDGSGLQPTTSQNSKPSTATSTSLPEPAQSQPSPRSILEPSPAQPDTAAFLSNQPIAEPERPASHPEVEAAEAAITSGEPLGKPPVDISRLVASLTAQYSDPSKLQTSPNSASFESPQSNQPSAALTPSAASLPPRPPQPDVQPQAHPAQHHPAGSNPSFPNNNTGASLTPSAQPPAASGYPADTSNPYAAAPDVSFPAQTYDQPAYSTPSHGAQNNSYQHAWDQFVADERQYMSEAKWDRFPEGSRIFIGTRTASGAAKDGAHIFSAGNLSSDKVSKRDVFDMFYRFGRLAQISLKSAYGFVQYHTPDEGQRAIDALEGAEVKGRRIHLEISKLQDKSKKDRQRSPDRQRRDSGRYNDSRGNQRNDFRGRERSPSRSDYHNNGYNRNQSHNDYGRRGRSRSPDYGRNSRDSYKSYRRRSPSPPRHQQSQPEIDLPRRYGTEVPDVQLILQDDLNRDFVSWVEGAFKNKGLTTNTMFLHPRMPKDQVIERQAAEGVHGVVDLDMRSQNLSKIPVQAFDRSGGSQNVRFDQYQDLDPAIAAEVITRTKATSAPAGYGQSSQSGPLNGYSQAYGGHQPPPQAQQYPPNPYYPQQQPYQQPPQQAPPQQPDLAAVLSQVDPSTLQQILQAAGHGQQQPQAGAPQPDLQKILGSLASGAPQQPPPQQGQYAATYLGQQSAQGGGDNAAEVQNIMANLARYRQ